MKKTVVCGGRPAEVEVLGQGPDVVFVGTAVPMAWTREAATDLAGLGYRVTNFDYGSGWDDPEPRTALQQVDDVTAVMNDLGLEAAVLVGLSRGAMTSYAFAAQYPDRVSALVLAFPVAGFEDTMLIVDPDPEPAEGEPEHEFMRRMLRTIFSDEFIESDLDRAVAMVTTPPGSVARVDRFDEAPFPADLEVAAKTLVIEGGADAIVKPEHPKRYMDAIADATLRFIPGAHHGWLMEEPSVFAGIIDDFLTG